MTFSDYLVFGPLRDTIRERNFTADKQVKEGREHGLSAKQKHYFLRTYRKLCSFELSALTIR